MMNFEDFREFSYILFVYRQTRKDDYYDGKKNNLDKLSNNYPELDTAGKNKLLRIGEKVLYVKNFVNKEILSLTENKDINEKFKNE
jgi:hypothetical protein